MNAICTKCGKQFFAASTEDAYDPDRLCGECYSRTTTVVWGAADGTVQPSLWVSAPDPSKAVPAFQEWSGEATAQYFAAQIVVLGKRADKAERRLKAALCLWLVSRGEGVHVTYDEYDSFVVAAFTEGEARRLHPDGSIWNATPFWGDNALISSWPIKPEDVTVKLIGIADQSLTPGAVLIASYNAG